MTIELGVLLSVVVMLMRLSVTSATRGDVKELRSDVDNLRGVVGSLGERMGRIEAALEEHLHKP